MQSTQLYTQRSMNPPWRGTRSRPSQLVNRAGLRQSHTDDLKYNNEREATFEIILNDFMQSALASCEELSHGASLVQFYCVLNELFPSSMDIRTKI